MNQKLINYIVKSPLRKQLLHARAVSYFLNKIEIRMTIVYLFVRRKTLFDAKFYKQVFDGVGSHRKS